ncbi:MAG: hypothetical protein HQ582_06600, partial [Planctomycetes bacterium]|nr:hypothetical protein [Planctomycetota bacterium]
MSDPSKKPKKLPRAVPLEGTTDEQKPAPPPAAGSSAEGKAGSFDFGNLAKTHEEGSRAALRRRSQQPPPLVVGGAILVFFMVIGGGIALWLGWKEPLDLKPISDHTIEELSTLRFTAGLRDADARASQLKYTLEGAPEGARINPDTGQFTWSPTEEQGPNRYEMAVRVEALDGKAIPARQAFEVTVLEINRPPVIDPIDHRSVAVDDTLTLEVKATDPNVPPKPVRFKLGPDAPLGARIDPVNGMFSWAPQDAKPGDVREITVIAATGERGAATARKTFRVRVAEPLRPVAQDPDLAIDQFVLFLKEKDAEVVVSEEEFAHPPLSGKLRVLTVDGHRVGAFGYGTAAEAERDAKGVSADDLEPFAASLPEQPSAYLFRHDRLIAFYVGREPTLLNLIDGWMGRPQVTKALKAQVEEMPVEVAEPSAQERGDEIILGLYNKNRLLAKGTYPALRKVYADRFEEEHREEIEQAFGGEGDEEAGRMLAWLEDHTDIKEELYLAIDPEHDKVPEVLRIFRELKEKFPKRFESYANLAIAVAVVWDSPDDAIHHSPVRQHSGVRPEGEVEAVENFQYLLETENVMQGRAQFLPWELLVHLVNHRTPLAERQWALNSYLPKRQMVGKCYDEVSCDEAMRSGTEPQLKGKSYTLANLHRFGGAPSVQADFAGRIAKCIGVPAFSVREEREYGDAHAWLVWVELTAVTETGITFSLQSHGRSQRALHYVGNARDPHTGQPVTDRQLELRLHTVGMNPIAKRQADLVMRSYPMLRERTELDTTEQFRFLSRVIDFSPGAEAAWIALAKMSREGQITKTNSKPMMHVLDGLFTTFARLPDFTWEVFDDLVAFQELPKQRDALFVRLVLLYEQAGRPDLASEARLKLAEHLVAEERSEEAVRGIGAAIMRSPDERTFVPKMLDRLEEMCREHEEAQKHLAQLYQQ